MLNGKSFRLNVETLGIESLSGKRVAVQVPAGSIVAVEAGPTPFDRSMILVSWNRRQLGMFLEDLQERASRSRGEGRRPERDRSHVAGPHRHDSICQPVEDQARRSLKGQGAGRRGLLWSSRVKHSSSKEVLYR